MTAGGGCEKNKALLILCLLSPQDMRKHVTMTLLDTEQSYVESLRTLMQVRLEAGLAWVPESNHSESRWLSDMWEQTHFVDRGLKLERNDPGASHSSMGGSPLQGRRECGRGLNAGVTGAPQGRCSLLLPSFHLPWQP